MLKVKSEHLPERCDICHQSDQFDPERNVCTRCEALKDSPEVRNAITPTVNNRVGLSRYFGLIEQRSRFAIYLGSILGVFFAVALIMTFSIVTPPKSAVSPQIIEKSAIENYQRGLSYQQAGDYDNALSAFSRVIHLNPSVDLTPTIKDAYLRMGVCFERLNDPDGAFQAYNQLYKRDSRNQDALLAIARIYKKSGHSPALALCYTQIALNYQLANNNQAAVDFYQNAVAISPDLRDAYCGLAEVYEKVGRHDDAKAAIDNCKHLSLSPAATK